MYAAVGSSSAGTSTLTSRRSGCSCRGRGHRLVDGDVGLVGLLREGVHAFLVGPGRDGVPALLHEAELVARTRDRPHQHEREHDHPGHLVQVGVTGEASALPADVHRGAPPARAREPQPDAGQREVEQEQAGDPEDHPAPGDLGPVEAHPRGARDLLDQDADGAGVVLAGQEALVQVVHELQPGGRLADEAEDPAGPRVHGPRGLVVGDAVDAVLGPHADGVELRVRVEHGLAGLDQADGGRLPADVVRTGVHDALDLGAVQQDRARDRDRQEHQTEGEREPPVADDHEAADRAARATRLAARLAAEGPARRSDAVVLGRGVEGLGHRRTPPMTWRETSNRATSASAFTARASPA